MIPELDLHNIRHSEVEAQIDTFIHKYHNRKELIIITGNSTDMKDLVINCIKDYGYNYEIGDFLQINTGFIRIF
jgi:hypothetical protein